MNTLGTGRHSELILEGPDSGSAEVSPEPCFLASCSFSLLRSDFSPSSSIAAVLLYFCCFISLSRSLTLFSSPSPNKQTKIPGEGCEIFTERVSWLLRNLFTVSFRLSLSPSRHSFCHRWMGSQCHLRVVLLQHRRQQMFTRGQVSRSPLPAYWFERLWHPPPRMDHATLCPRMRA